MRALPIPVNELTEHWIAAFWAKVDRRGPDECWPWLGYCSDNGYGQASMGQKRRFQAQRVVWVLAHPDEPQPPVVRHLVCDNPPCCNLAHLAGGTYADNSADMVAKDRQASGDRNGARIHPESRARGDGHWTHLYPDLLKRGDENPARQHPERMARGDRHGAHLHPERIARGMNHPCAKLVDEDAIRRRYAQGGISQEALGREYGIDQTLVSMIVRNVRWRRPEKEAA